GAGQAAVPVEVSAQRPVAPPIGAGPGRTERRGRARAATSGATRSIAMPEPDEADRLSGP
ncbi:MAG TPA: hypothetical protein VFT20_11975, partial [Candidatus Limnocylindrales bacterium]|nr:hypothetical protein [Candidatus Limnocylindrales bacterium]